ncbi:glycosyltransferase family 2 protein [Prevotella sp. A2931]|uniref:Glycosyltransferase family 2 protein n=2 Tax=Prevotella illustrans TaxID=2800387 RepID=A0ABS3M2J0_9BACT|nr:glycosyltransferase family 2 protein [Prevotella sp. oral taxon 820]MBO1362354.1 glycosyltransferase family 2 protein [Prevotella illustrans]PTL25128.1 glycosyl transferase family 2 [Prevotella sp. oral taxon 820]
MKLSVIIPIFNTGPTLERCVKSVAMQGIDNMEIIVIDDGSTDPQCNLLCKQLCLTIPQMIYQRQNHAGLSAARNHGLEIATGTYVTFIDSDDYLEPGTFAAVLPLFDKDSKIDLVEFSYIDKEGHDKLSRTVCFQDLEYEGFRDYWLKGKAYRHAYMWNKIFKRWLFDKVRFPVAKNFEDVAVLPDIVKQCQKVLTTHLGFYHYTWNKNGITANASVTDLSFLLKTNIEILKETSDKEYYKSILNIQLDAYGLGNKQLELPIMPYYGTIKLYVLHLLGLKNLCKLILFYHKVIKTLR